MYLRVLCVALAGALVWQSSGRAASRTWKSRKGVEVKAEFTGVGHGKVILKLPGNIRRAVRLSDFCLEDRDYLVEQLTKRKRQKDMEQLLQLMAFENAVPVIDPDADNDGFSDSGESDGYELPNPGPRNPLTHRRPGQAALKETQIYGLPMPSQELLQPDGVRQWTSLVGLKQPATFDRVLAPGFFRLKKADGTVKDYAIVNFVKEDIEYVKKLLQKDMARPVFPESSGFKSLTPEDVGRGYRVWTDRNDVTLVGKFVAVKGDDVVLEVDGENKDFPKAGLSESDRKWVDDEVQRRREEAEANRQAARESGRSGIGSSFPRRSSRFGSERGGGNEYAEVGGPDDGTSRFGRRGRFGTGSRETSSDMERTSRNDSMFPEVPKIEYRLKCPRCDHRWTSSSSVEHCPRCSSNRTRERERSSSGLSSVSTTSSDTNSSVSPTEETSGVLMTIVYVALGLSVLGGIAGGLFRAFG